MGATLAALLDRRRNELSQHFAAFTAAEERLAHFEKHGQLGSSKVLRVAVKQLRRAVWRADDAVERVREARDWRWMRALDESRQQDAGGAL